MRYLTRTTRAALITAVATLQAVATFSEWRTHTSWGRPALAWQSLDLNAVDTVGAVLLISGLATIPAMVILAAGTGGREMLRVTQTPPAVLAPSWPMLLWEKDRADGRTIPGTAPDEMTADQARYRRQWNAAMECLQRLRAEGTQGQDHTCPAIPKEP